MSVVESLVTLCEPFAKVYNHSKVLSIGTTYLHLASMLGAGGLAISADKDSLRLPSTGPSEVARHVASQQALHRWVVAGLAVSVISGVMMFASDVETFAKSLLYWSKMGGVALLLGNGLLLQRAERALAADPADTAAAGRLRLSAGVSLVLWFVVALLGVIVKTEA
jgi:hypothetical protein